MVATEGYKLKAPLAKQGVRCSWLLRITLPPKNCLPM